ncbi:MAG: hypothetical protein FJ276_14500 [Planctomycetes bacterium]|nr:hypothetical protein [Planctomycetota bacterium]
MKPRDGTSTGPARASASSPTHGRLPNVNYQTGPLTAAGLRVRNHRPPRRVPRSPRSPPGPPPGPPGPPAPPGPPGKPPMRPNSGC